jgi:hypothetical protein
MPFHGSSYFALVDNATTYVGMGELGSTDVKVSIPLAIGGSLGNLRVKLDADADISGGAGGVESYTLTVMVNGNASGVTCQVIETATTCTDTTNSIVVAAGDTVSLRAVPANTPAEPTLTWSFLIQ